MRLQENLQELLYAIQYVSWDIIGLSEVRRNGEAIEKHSRFILYYRRETPGRHGVGFLIKKELKNYIDKIIGISEMIAVLNILIPPMKYSRSIIQIYSTTQKSENH